MGTIEKKLTDLFAQKNGIPGIDSNRLNELEKSVKEYHDLVEKGIARPRGYNLLTIDSNIPNLEFNHF